jgi:hypothetical protein
MFTQLPKRAHRGLYLSMPLTGFLALLSVEACMANEDVYRLPPADEQDACPTRRSRNQTGLSVYRYG